MPSTTLNTLLLRAENRYPQHREYIDEIREVIKKFTIVYDFTNPKPHLTASELISTGRVPPPYRKKDSPPIDWYLEYSEDLVGATVGPGRIEYEDKAVLDRLISTYAEYPRDYRSLTMDEMRHETGEYDI